VAGNRHEANDLASVDERHEKAGREMLVVARPVRDLVITRVVDGDGALLANGAPARRVLGKGWIGVELLDQGVRSDGESIGAVRARPERRAKRRTTPTSMAPRCPRKNTSATSVATYATTAIVPVKSVPEMRIPNTVARMGRT